MGEGRGSGVPNRVGIQRARGSVRRQVSLSKVQRRGGGLRGGAP
jgi:hypothetical protein